MAASETFPVLTEKQIALFREHGEEVEVKKGTVLIEHGTRHYDFFIVLGGCIEIQDPSRGGALIADHRKFEFSGDTDILSDRSAVFRAVAGTDSTYLRVPNKHLKSIIAKYSDISDKLLRAFFLRRNQLLNETRGGIQLIGSRFSQHTYNIRNFLSKNQVRHQWIDLEKDQAATEILQGLGIPAGETPIVIDNAGNVYRNPTISRIAECLGLSTGWEKERYDLLVVGAGPGGLAASVYGASEGLSVLTIDSVGPGGQAGKSSKIENYLGFPSGLSGSDLANRAYLQAQKFGCTISVPHQARRLEFQDNHYVLQTVDDLEFRASSVIIATGADYRNLPLENNEKFEGNGIYYSATAMQAETCRDEVVGIVGGGNSAGQAALFLADYATEVHMVLRSNNLGKSMSDYLVQRIKACDNIRVHYQSHVSRLEGNSHLEAFDITTESGETQHMTSSHLFIFIGARPCTDWVGHLIATDPRGFILTGADIQASSLDGYQPQSLETSMPGLFAVGDVRSGSTKRVASAVGEGSVAVSMVHKFLGAV